MPNSFCKSAMSGLRFTVFFICWIQMYVQTSPIILIGSTIWRSIFWQNPPIIVLFRTWEKVWNGSISKSKFCLKKKRLDFSCHTTPECFNCLVFFSRQTLIVRTSEMFTLIVILCLFFHGQQAPLFPTH